jgi:hypothetical protein
MDLFSYKDHLGTTLKDTFVSVFVLFFGTDLELRAFTLSHNTSPSGDGHF